MGEMDSLTELEKKRYKLQIMLPGIGARGQEKIKDARVLVVGIGGLGSQVLQYLAAMGVGTLGFLDYDVIEEVNLSHQVLYGMEDIGKLKAVVTRKRLSAMNPLVQLNMLNVKFKSDNAGSIVPGYDIVVDATNKREEHCLISDSCLKYNKIMVLGCVCSKLEGRISVFNYGGGPSYRCLNSEDHSEEQDAGKNITGMPGILPGITGAFVANEVIRIITGSHEVLSGKMLTIDIFGYINRIIPVEKNPHNFNRE